MTRVASTELEKLDPEVKECQVIYVPQVNKISTIYMYVSLSLTDCSLVISCVLNGHLG